MASWPDGRVFAHSEFVCGSASGWDQRDWEPLYLKHMVYIVSFPRRSLAKHHTRDITRIV